MSSFASDAQAREVIGGFLELLPRLDPVIKQVTGQTPVVMKLELTGPSLAAEIDLSREPLLVRMGSDAFGQVGMSCATADFHRLLLGRMALATGINRKTVVVRGSIALMMKAVPLFYVVPYIYPYYLESIGRKDLIEEGELVPLHADQALEGVMNRLVAGLSWLAGFALGIMKRLSPGLDVVAALESLGRGLSRASGQSAP